MPLSPPLPQAVGTELFFKASGSEGPAGLERAVTGAPGARRWRAAFAIALRTSSRRESLDQWKGLMWGLTFWGMSLRCIDR
jgi:hypothetical protein